MLSLGLVASGMAAFVDQVSSLDNSFESGSLELAISDIDENEDGVAEGIATNWSEQTTATWQSPADWQPGESFSSAIFLRNQGTVDAKSLKWKVTNKVDSGVDLDKMVRLNTAWYDRNSSGVMDPEENLFSALKAQYDTGADGTVTLWELHQGMTEFGHSFELEPGESFLPGESDMLVGGYDGVGKGLVLEWIFDEAAGNEYQDASVTVDFEFTAASTQ